MILPADNRQNVEEDLTPAQTEGVTIHYASRVEDVLAVALPLLNAHRQGAAQENPEAWGAVA